MIEKRFGVQMPAIEKWLVVVAALFSGIGLGIAIAQFHLGWREMFIFLFGVVAALAVLVPDDRVFTIGLGAGVASIAFGWRTLSVTPDLVFAPFEFVVWFLIGALVLKNLIQRRKLRFHLSIPLALFLVLFIPAGVVAWGKGVSPDKIIGYGKNVFMIAPFFLVVQNLVRDLGTWKRIMFVAIGVGLYLSLTGLILIVIPPLGRVLSRVLVTQVDPTADFTRIGFAGWGPLAAWFFILVFGVVVGLWESAQDRLHRLFYVGVLIILGGGILVSGQRGAWLALLAGFAVYALLSPQRGVILIALIGILILLLPQGNFLLRFESAFVPSLYDSSAADRYYRAGIALDAIAKNPLLGLGFGVMTYVHSDYLEIGAAMGVIALGLFVAALGVTGWRLLRLQFSVIDNQMRLLVRGALITFVILVVEMLSAGFVTLAFTTVITWFFWAMCDQFVTLVEESGSVTGSSEYSGNG